MDIIADTTHLVSNNAQLSVTVEPPLSAADGAWYDRNLHNTDLIALLKNLGADGSLSRGDMISVFDAMAALPTIDASTLSDLRLLRSNGVSLGMPDFVINLSDKTVNYDAANDRFQGLVLGNLAAGDSGSKLHTLMSKWFLGAGTPETRNYSGGSTIYSYINSARSMNLGGIDNTGGPSWTQLSTNFRSCESGN